MTPSLLEIPQATRTENLKTSTYHLEQCVRSIHKFQLEVLDLGASNYPEEDLQENLVGVHPDHLALPMEEDLQEIHVGVQIPGAVHPEILEGAYRTQDLQVLLAFHREVAVALEVVAVLLLFSLLISWSNYRERKNI